MSSATRVGEAVGLFQSIRLPHPGQEEIDDAFDELRSAAQAAPGEPMGGVQVIAPIGAGKTQGAWMHARRVNERADPDTIPVLVVTLNTAGTTKSVPISILEALGEPRAEKGDETTLWKRVRRALAKKRVELLVLDEMDRAARRPTIRHHIANALRDLADDAVVPLAFLCTEKSAELFRNASDLSERLYAPVLLERLDWLVEEDRKLIVQLAEGFDREVVIRGILPQTSGLGEPYVAEKLAIASNGILRQFKFIILTALASVVRRGDERIESDDLRIAVEEYSIAKGFLRDNPFGTD
jgi:hypothetical protein